jgi:hypothetical protein
MGLLLMMFFFTNSGVYTKITEQKTKFKLQLLNVHILRYGNWFV